MKRQKFTLQNLNETAVTYDTLLIKNDFKSLNSYTLANDISLIQPRNISSWEKNVSGINKMMPLKLCYFENVISCSLGFFLFVQVTNL